MADDRTPEQRAADEQLDAAIRAVTIAYNPEDAHEWAPTEFVCIYSMTRWDDEGDAYTAVCLAVDGNSVPVHRQLGLVEYAAARLRRTVMAPFWEEN